MKIEHSHVHNILVIKLRAIGDVLLSTVVLKNLRAAFPDACIDFLTENPSKNAVEGNPAIDTVLVFDSKTQSSINLPMLVRRRQYDLVIDLFGNPRSAIVALTSGARYRVGYRFTWRQHCYNSVIEPRGGKIHNVQFNLDALDAIGIPIVDRSLFFPIGDHDRAFANDFFYRNGLDHAFVVALNPGGGWYTKRWPSRHFAELGNRIARTFGAKVLITWGPGEQDLADEIASSMSEPAMLIPPASLKQLGAILEACSVMVTNDSGPMHIASTLGTPVVAIFGPTVPELQGPVNEKSIVARNSKLVCLGCNYTTCPIGNPCMEELSVNDVFHAFKQLCDAYSLLPNYQHERSAD
ncbi:MAG: glycosyltransferase family 9 protein [Ignavibacteriae bacterium]|nr:glycosyltransferase family 9 protein [Ignavibacteria bacterium]MBI3364910.1 glycosyltransferase family 9 protein [Ignavibacteriota bacterium]